MQLALPIAGAALGNFIAPGLIGVFGLTGASAGWLAGSMLAGSLQTQKTQGPRLSDLKLSGSAYGAPIPYIFGHPRVGGQIIWGSDKREISTTTSRRAKGGPKIKNTTFTYEVDLLYKLSCNALAGVTKMYVNGEMQWSSSTGADYGTIEASATLARRITVYTGAADQLPDPTVEAEVGIGNAPANRGSLTIMFEGLQLGNAGQIPNITFEVADGLSGTVSNSTIVTLLTPGATVIQAAWDVEGAKYWQRATIGGSVLKVGTVSADGNNSLLADQSFPTMDWDPTGHMDHAVAYNVQPYPNSQAMLREFDGSPLKILLTTPGEMPNRYEIVGDQVWLSSASALYYFLIDPAYRVGFGSDERYDPVVRVSSVKYSSMAYVDGTLYCLRAGALGVRDIDVRDALTLSVLDTFASPASLSGDAELLLDEFGALLLLAHTTLYRWTGTAWATEMTLAVGYGTASSGSDLGYRSFPRYVGGVLRVLYFTGGVYYLRASWKVSATTEPTLASVVTTLCGRVGIAPSQIDVTALTGLNVAAFPVAPGTTRSALEVLMRAYFFEASAADKIRFVRRGGAPVATIPWDDLGASETWENEGEPLPISVRNDLEKPAYITVKSMNTLNDYQDGAQSSARIASWSTAESIVELPLGLTPEQGQHVADVMARDVQTTLTNVGPLKLQQKWAALQPCDVVLVQDREGNTFRVRLERREASNGIYSLQGTFDDATVIDGAGVTDEDYLSTTTIRAPQPTNLVLLDMPLLRDVDDDLGYYAAIRNLGQRFDGATVFRSTDDVDYASVGDILSTGITGTTVGALGNYSGGNFPDEANVVRVNVGPGVTLSSITWAEAILEEQNAWLIGNEVVVARLAVYVSDGVYDLRGLSRGRRGTGWAQTGHGSSERAVLLRFDGMRRIGGDASELSQLRYHRAVTFGKSLDSAITVPLTNTAVSAKPYAPVDARVSRTTTDVTITWGRRTRYAENWLLGSTPLGEATESWEIVRYTSGSFTTVAAAYTSTTNSVTFANTDPAVYVDIFQMSDRVGRGYALRATL